MTSKPSLPTDPALSTPLAPPRDSEPSESSLHQGSGAVPTAQSHKKRKAKKKSKSSRARVQANSPKPAIQASNVRQGGERTAGGKAGLEGSAEGEQIGVIMDEHARFENALREARAVHGLEHPESLQAAFDVINSNIGLYRLEACEKVLLEIFPECERDRGSTWHLKAVQARAFLRYKQHRFRESLQDFELFKNYAGPSPELAENTGHAHNTLGNYLEAEACFTEALELMDLPDTPAKGRSNRGGVLLGLGLVKDRLKRTEEGLKLMQEALEFYRSKFGGSPHSLVAKTLMSIASVHERAKRLDKAEAAFKEAMEIFQFTCGDDTPLTANAMHSLAKVQCARGTNAFPLLLRSLELYASFDTLHVYMNIIVEILNFLKTTQMEAAQKPASPAELEALEGPGGVPATLVRIHNLFKPILPVIQTLIARLREPQAESDQGTLAVFCKYSGEIAMLAGASDIAGRQLTQAILLLKSVTELDVSGLISECEGLLAFVGSSRQAK